MAWQRIHTTPGEGLRVRLRRIPGETLKSVLPRPVYLQCGINGEWTLEESAEHSEYRTVGSGEMSQPAGGQSARGRNLRRTSIDTLTIDYDAPWVIMHGMSPEAVQKALYDIHRHRTPFELLVTWDLARGPHELKMFATLRQVNRTIKPGESDTRYFALQIAEWRDPIAERRSSRPHKLPTTHRLKAGDTLYKLAQLYYGNWRHWLDIAKANGIRRWGAKTPLVKMKRFDAGSVLKIPKLSPRDRHVRRR